MQTCLAVGAGGALGAICRYLFSLIPFPGPFPVATLLINLFGAVVIGFVTGLAEHQPNIPFGLILFLKTGVCGGDAVRAKASRPWYFVCMHQRSALCSGCADRQAAGAENCIILKSGEKPTVSHRFFLSGLSRYVPLSRSNSPLCVIDSSSCPANVCASRTTARFFV